MCIGDRSFFFHNKNGVRDPFPYCIVRISQVLVEVSFPVHLTAGECGLDLNLDRIGGVLDLGVGPGAQAEGHKEEDEELRKFHRHKVLFFGFLDLSMQIGLEVIHIS